MSSSEILEEVEEKETTEEIKVGIEVDKKKLEEAKKTLEETFSGLKKNLDKITGGIKKALSGIADTVKTAFGEVKESVTSSITDAFTVTSAEEYTAAAERFGEEMAGSLFSIQENLGLLEASIVDAIAPIAGVFVPVIDEALGALLELSSSIGQVTGALFGSSAGTDAFTQSVATASEAANQAVNLNPVVNDSLSPQLQAVVDKVQSLMVPLQQIDLSPLQSAFYGIQTALTSLTQDVFGGLEWAYLNIFAPLGAWTTEGMLPAFLGLLSGAVTTVSSVLTAFQPLCQWLWESFLQPIADWTGGVITDVLQVLGEKLGNISRWITENQALIEGLVIVIGSVTAAITLVNKTLGLITTVMKAWNVICAVGKLLTGQFGAAMGTVSWPVVAVTAAIAALIAIVVLLAKNWDTVKEKAIYVWGVIQDAFGKAGQWFQEKLFNPLANGFKAVVNGIIGFINRMISCIVSGINGVIKALNKLHFTVPDWVPGLGGETMGFNLRTLTAPQIPYLAKGAVLPANKPFMAVVGDQRHGTNIEAPLTTIQEAVGLVMEEHISAMMAGFQALLEEQRAIRRTIECIEIGDDVIGEAAKRYDRKMAVVYGG